MRRTQAIEALTTEVTHMMHKLGVTDEWFDGDDLTWNEQARKEAAHRAGVKHTDDEMWNTVTANLQEELAKLEVCDSCEGNGEDQAPFDYLNYLPQGGPCRFCGGRGSFPVGSYYDSRLARLVMPGDSSWRAEMAS